MFINTIFKVKVVNMSSVRIEKLLLCSCNKGEQVLQKKEKLEEKGVLQ